MRVRNLRPGLPALLSMGVLFLAGCPTISGPRTGSDDLLLTGGGTINLPRATPTRSPAPGASATPTPTPGPTSGSGTGASPTPTPTATPTPNLQLSILEPAITTLYLAGLAEAIPPSSTDSVRLQSEVRVNGATVSSDVTWSILTNIASVDLSPLTASSSVVRALRQAGADQANATFSFSVTVQAATSSAGVSRTATRSIQIRNWGSYGISIF